VVGRDNTDACVFPFTHEGVVYSRCSYVANGGRPWCSLQTDAADFHVSGKWQDCTYDSADDLRLTLDGYRYYEACRPVLLGTEATTDALGRAELTHLAIARGPAQTRAFCNYAAAFSFVRRIPMGAADLGDERQRALVYPQAGGPVRAHVPGPAQPWGGSVIERHKVYNPYRS
jgi:hypothetical protein